jgi:hypothetical protein
MMQDIAKVAIPGKILMAAWAVTGGGLLSLLQQNELE